MSSGAVQKGYICNDCPHQANARGNAISLLVLSTSPFAPMFILLFGFGFSPIIVAYGAKVALVLGIGAAVETVLVLVFANAQSLQSHRIMMG